MDLCLLARTSTSLLTTDAWSCAFVSAIACRMYLKSSAFVTYIFKSVNIRISYFPTPFHVFNARKTHGLHSPEMMATKVLKLASRYECYFQG